ncbi:polysaccharide deacetylase family protein [Pseudooceanicola aestuarii]|uniref:polysaccharide deacetylase family protein n=1 Tax=Pseudooceanicola aestuarii TaxID=2697319 RepID=UPI0013D68FBC|nr:polysaccharide deacetylase family protein [Pseudooceanicola aestuarii]
MTGPGQFAISLDFELLWGVRDHSDKASYGGNVLGAREAIPAILDLFAQFEIQATWATVGFLFCESKEELLSVLPEERPAYDDPKLSNYTYLDEVGEDERRDPYYFAASIIERIQETPGQEIGTHTFSHFYCLETGATAAAFDADLRAAQDIARRRGVTLKSIVFPRNQFGPENLKVCQDRGIEVYRGNPAGWAYRSANSKQQTPLRRAVRLLDAHTGALGSHVFGPDPLNLPAEDRASRFLRPCVGRLARLHPLHVGTVCRGMTQAARAGQSFHLWWHPHNFGRDPEANMSVLETVLTHYRALRDEHGMQSRTMGALS